MTVLINNSRILLHYN